MLPRLSGSILLMVALAVATPCSADPAEDLAHWAWKKPERPKVPIVEPQPTNPIDAFVRAKLKDAGLSPAPRASREQLIRRVTFDLTGLPPTPEEIDAFVADKSPDAWEKVIDRLLAIAALRRALGAALARPRPLRRHQRLRVRRTAARRLALSRLRHRSRSTPTSRTTASSSNNSPATKPFPGDPDALIATGFNLLGPDMTDASDQAQRRQNTLNDMTDTAGLAFLGLTITCARCHDHKFEPIPQKDYYRLQAFFTPAAFRRDLSVATAAEKKAREAKQREYFELTKELREQIAATDGPPRQKLFEAKLAKLSPDAQAAHRTPPEKRTGGQLELVAETEGKVRVTDAEIAKELSDGDKSKLEDLQAPTEDIRRSKAARSAGRDGPHRQARPAAEDVSARTRRTREQGGRSRSPASPRLSCLPANPTRRRLSRSPTAPAGGSHSRSGSRAPTTR